MKQGLAWVEHVQNIQDISSHLNNIGVVNRLVQQTFSQKANQLIKSLECILQLQVLAFIDLVK